MKDQKNSALEKVVAALITQRPLAVGLFGSSAINGVRPSSDIDMYVLANHTRKRVITREGGNIFEVYYSDPKIIQQMIGQKDIRIVDRMRNSKPLYDPQKIYQNLIESARKEDLRYEEWVEKTIIGGEYDLVERTESSINRSLVEGHYLEAVSSLRYLVDRIVEVGLRRLNFSGHANPRETPNLVESLPLPTREIYKSLLVGVDIPGIAKIMDTIKNEKEKLFPETK